jgi:glutamate 5-kinase
MSKPSHRQALRGAQRIIVKLGTSSCLVEDDPGLTRVQGEVILPLARDIARLRERGLQVVVVSSGAVGMGRRTRWGSRIDSRELSAKQALAALGQVELMNMWRGVFELLGIGVAQVLLTRQELSRRERYLNARNTLATLLAAGVLPVVNENDSVATDEIRFGDNDILAALVGSLVEAQLVINLTRAEGLLDLSGDQPTVIPEVAEVDESLFGMVAPEISTGGTGGMASKLHAAKEAARYGAAMVIANSSQPGVLLDILDGKEVGTLFWPASDPLRGKKRWLASSTMVSGQLKIDAGAHRALTVKGSSLLTVGITAVEGEFRTGDIVSVTAPNGAELGRGLCNLASTELRSLLTTRSVGASSSKVAIHRDNLFLREG